MNRFAALSLSITLVACASAPSTSGPSDTEIDELIAMMAPSSPKDSERIAASLAAFPLGSPENPIRSAGPRGQREYLARLRCPDGSAPVIGERSSSNIGPYGKILDNYPVSCSGWLEPKPLYLDLYHPEHREARAPQGFAITP